MDQHSKLGYREGLVSVILNLLLFVLKYYAGIASASLALIADAWHTLSDSLTSLVVILGIKFPRRNRIRSIRSDTAAGNKSLH